MTIRIGYIPYLNMAPFHQGFGPRPLQIQGQRIEFLPMSPHALGLEAEKDAVDAGALSLADLLRLSGHYEPVGTYGIGVRREAQSVLLFSKVEMSSLSGMVAVTDETSTSFRLLQLLLDVRYKRTGIQYGRIASSVLFDGDANGLLLIGDEALRAKKEGIKGLPVVTDLGEEWYRWHNLPFVFARWAIRRALPPEIKALVATSIQKSLEDYRQRRDDLAGQEALQRQMSAADVTEYWNDFSYELTSEHERSIQIFSELLETANV